MIALLQAVAMSPTGPSWQSIAVVCGGVLQSLVLFWMKQGSDERQEMRNDLKTLHDDVMALNTHVGVDGNGIMARLDEISRKLDALSTEMAEARGRLQHVRTQGGHQ
jgi:hypothetical protein